MPAKPPSIRRPGPRPKPPVPGITKIAAVAQQRSLDRVKIADVSKHVAVAAPLQGEAITEDTYKDAFNLAAVPYRHRFLKLAELEAEGYSGNVIRQYANTETGQLDNDIQDARGVTMIGDAYQRNMLFPMFARTLVILFEPCYYIQLSDLADALLEPEDNNRVLDAALRTPALFIDGFYEGDIDNPYDRKEVRRIEAFVRERINQKRRMYLSTSRDAIHMSWYSHGLQQMLATHNRNITV